MNDDVRQEAIRCHVSRLCHLTPFRNLVHIATGGGLLSATQLSTTERQVFNQQDLLRLDQHPDHISCSIEFPNAWYLRQRRRSARGAERLFPDWVCLCIEPHHLWRDDTLFCPRNAASGSGRFIGVGVDAFMSLYADRVEGAGGQTFIRGRRESACPTDEQAEILIYRRIPLDDLQQIVVADESQAKRVFVGLEQLGVPADRLHYSICPEFFDPTSLASLLRRGLRPTELRWNHEGMSHE